MASYLILAVLAILTLLAFSAGLARSRFTRAPLIASIVIVAGYLILLASVAAVVSSCPGCIDNGEDSRLLALFNAWFFGGLLALGEVAITWTGAWLSTRIWKDRQALTLRFAKWACGILAAIVAGGFLLLWP